MDSLPSSYSGMIEEELFFMLMRSGILLLQRTKRVGYPGFRSTKIHIEK